MTDLLQTINPLPGESPQDLTVRTDRPEYAPGSTVTITVDGLEAGASVQLAIADDPDHPGDDGDADVYEPFSVTDGGAGDLDGLANGVIVTSWLVPVSDSEGGPYADALNATLNLTATSSTGQVAMTSFRDALPPPVQTYFVPLPETPLLTTFNTIQGSVPLVQDVRSVISMAIAATGTVIYYDHWEDGYEVNATNPLQSTTEIWGDGNVANGTAPGEPDDIFEAGDAFVLDNVVDLTPSRNPSQIFYDGADRVQASFPISMTRGAWPISPGSVLAGATEVLDTDTWGTKFIAPFGENTLNTANDPLEYTALYVMAGQPNTEVYLNNVLQTTLNAGGNFVVRVNEDDVLSTSKPVQVDIATGDIGSIYEMRWSALAPLAQWGNDYYSPVGTQPKGDGSGSTRVWLYNPSDSAINIAYDFLGGGSPDGVINVGSKSVVLSPFIPDNSGVHFYSQGGEAFLPLSYTDVDPRFDSGAMGDVYDWDTSLVPAHELTYQAIVSWGYGTTNPNGDPARSVVFVTPVSQTDLWVDYDGAGLRIPVKVGDNIVALSSLKLIDPVDQNMTGAIIYTLNEAMDGPGANIAVAWGQDPARSGSGDPQGLDLGTLVPPLPILEAGKTASLANDADGDGKFTPGDTIEYTISIVNLGQVPLPVNSFNVLDFTGVVGPDVFDETNYVLNSTTYQGFAVADNGSTPFPLDESGFLNPIALNVGGTHTIKFRTTIKPFEQLTPGTDSIVNNGQISPNGSIQFPIDTFGVQTPLGFRKGIDIEKFTNGQDADSTPGPLIMVDGQVTWTYEVKNTGNVWLGGISVTDDQTGVNPMPVDDDNNGKNDGDTNGDNILQPGETWLYRATGTATRGQYSNIGTATGNPVYSDGTTPVPGLLNPSDTDPSHYFGAKVDVELVKKTNGLDNANAFIDEGDPVTWTYEVHNIGDIGIPDENISLRDDKIGAINTGSYTGDSNNNATLDVGETWTYTAPTGFAIAGPYTNLGTVTATASDQYGNTRSDSASEPDGYTGVPGDLPGLGIQKYTNASGAVGNPADYVSPYGYDADLETGPYIPVGNTVTWTYVVTNNTTLSLSSISVIDSQTGVTPVYQSGDNGDGILQPRETWIYTATGTAIAGQYGNVGALSATFGPTGQTYNVSDPSHYFGELPGIHLEKLVNGDDADTAPGLSVTVPSTVTFTYLVTNTGNTPISSIAVSDDKLGNITNFTGGDTDGDSKLDLGETWTYSATAPAQTGLQTNLGTVTGTDVFNQTVTDDDPANYTGANALPPPPGVRTPGFWGQSKWQTFWDGNPNNQPSQQGQPNFPTGDLFYPPYTNSTVPGQVKDPVTGDYETGILIGDFDRNGMTSTGENTLFYTTAQAMQIINASNSVQGADKRYTLDRSLIASWLNYLAGNPIDTANPTDKDARYYIKEGIDWLQALTPNQNSDLKGDGYLRNLVGNETLIAETPPIPASSAYWNSGISNATDLPNPYNLNTNVMYPVDAGNTINGALDAYNNGLGYADGVFHGG